MDNLNYHGHDPAIVWDRTGKRYQRGKGLQVPVDVKQIASSPELGKPTMKLPAVKVIPVDKNPKMNFAVNNDGDYYPRYEASFVNPSSSLAKLSDGQFVCDIVPANRRTAVDSPNSRDWVEVDFGMVRTIDKVKLYVINDQGAKGPRVKAPAKIELEASPDFSEDLGRIPVIANHEFPFDERALKAPLDRGRGGERGDGRWWCQRRSEEEARG